MIALSATVPAAARADYPPAVNLSEMQPPSEEEKVDWALSRLQRQWGAHACLPPLRLQTQIQYYPCPPAAPCGETPHRSFRGQYGLRHPMPYYVPAIHVGVPDLPPSRCRTCQPGAAPVVLPEALEVVEPVSNRGRRRSTVPAPTATANQHPPVVPHNPQVRTETTVAATK